MKITVHPLLTLIATIAVGFSLASPTYAHKPPKASADFTRVVVIGDSLLAGFRNGSLSAGEQENGIAAFIARQAGFELIQPLIVEPGIPNKLELHSVDPLVIEPAPGFSTGRVAPLVQVNNLAVPGETVGDALHKHPDFNFDDLGDLILGLPGLLGGVSKSQVEWAEAMQPTFAIIWLGANDTLGAALDGDASLVTPFADFERDYKELMARMDATGADLVVANIPDVTVIPYLTPATEVAAQAGAPLAVIGPVLGLKAGDYITPDALPLIPAILGGAQAGPLPGNVVLDAAEVATIRAATDKFNKVIAREAKRYNAVHLDIYAFLNSVDKCGYVAGTNRLTTEFLGGFFSLDGFHPTITGSAATANEFIKVFNRGYHTDIPLVRLRPVAEADPLVLPSTEIPRKKWKHFDRDFCWRMRWLLHRRW